MTLGLIIAGVVVVVVIFVAWLMELTAPTEAWIRIASLEYRKNRALKEIRAEGQVTRELIRAAGRQRTQADLDRWIARKRNRRARRRRAVVGLGLAASLLVVIVVAVWPRSSPHVITASPQSSLDSVIAKLAKGECTNFTNNFQTGALPQHPEIVPCSQPAATFKVAWLGESTSDGQPCPQKYSSLTYWTASSGLTVCMDRMYHIGQCMQGDQENDVVYDWIDEAVVPCSLAPTAQYPYVVRIVYLYRQADDSCPDNSGTESDPDDAAGLTLCIDLWSQHHARKGR
jgi:hypothetical protein